MKTHQVELTAAEIELIRFALRQARNTDHLASLERVGGSGEVARYGQRINFSLQLDGKLSDAMDI